jgi:hypothetical protein
LTRSATRPRPCCGCGRLKSSGSTGPSSQQSNHDQPGHDTQASNLGNHPRPWPCWRMRAVRRGDRVELTIGPRKLRGGVAAAEAPPARPTLGGSRSFERGCTGRAGRCSRPRRKFEFRRRRAPSVRRRRRGVCHCVSAQPCLHCSLHPSRANSSRPRGTPPVGVAVVASDRLPPAGSSSRVVLVDRVGLGWLGMARRARPYRGRCVVGRASARPAQIDGQVAGCRGPANPRAARPSIWAREVAWP